ncbi:GNAT family N-acetyltransferase [Streptomyces sp. NBC_01465]|uniref:GNAT family N-acetyltransferase n=1 Tax=Streptomyces sp. NBC_01465 TaxID=2903878 RepID=UPI002E37F02D|nr:GNAT family N-acetyltransferase [Streptomyces sp. NBC_01465]
MPALVTPAIAAGSLSATEQPVLPVGVEGDVVLRPWLPGDAGAVMVAYQDPAIQRWHARRMDSLAEAGEWVERWRGSWKGEQGAHWAVADSGSGAVLGKMSLRDLNLVDGTATISYWVAPEARGSGVCPRALGVLAQWALGEVGFHRLELEHSTGNPASCRVAEKAGFAAEGVRRGAALHADGWHDMHLHARVRQA